MPAVGPEAGSPAESPLARLEGATVGVLLLAMVALPAGETLARRFLGRGLSGSAILVQHLTLWVGFLG
ncbi:MAG TPA: hypothetical protein VF400_16480, partial [Anaeromyxobacteraceae bacterium]